MSTNYEGLEFIAEHAATKQAHDMELRDYFAAKAMQTILNGVRGVTPENQHETFSTIAGASYAVADAMLAARSKT